MRVKWRMTSISLTSGNPSIESRTNSRPSAEPGSTAGTSRGGISMPRLPGADFSKISPSSRLTWRPAGPVEAATISVSVAFGFNANSSLDRGFQNSPDGSAKPLDLGSRKCFREPPESALGQFRVLGAERKRTDDFLAQQRGVDQFYRPWELERELVKSWPGERTAYTRNFFELGKREARLRKILRGHFAQAFLPEQTQMNRGHQSVQRFIRANVRGGLLAPNVLFARGQRQDEAAPSSRVRGLSRQAAGHLTHVFLARGDHSNVRTSVAWRDAQR